MTPLGHVRGPLAPMLAAHTGAQIRLFWRSRISILTMALPLMLYAFFGLANGQAQYAPGVTVATYMLASLGAYGVSSVMVFNFGLVIATERGGRWDALVRVSPLPPAVYLTAKTLAAVVFGILSLAVLFAFAYVAGNVRLAGEAWAAITLALLLGCVPFIAMGFAMGYGFSPSSAPAFANLIFLFLAFASGLFVPLKQMPSLVQDIAPYLPTYHYGQLAWGAVGLPVESTGTSAAWLVGYGVALFAASIWAYRRAEKRV